MQTTRKQHICICFSICFLMKNNNPSYNKRNEYTFWQPAYGAFTILHILDAWISLRCQADICLINWANSHTIIINILCGFDVCTSAYIQFMFVTHGIVFETLHDVHHSANITTCLKELITTMLQLGQFWQTAYFLPYYFMCLWSVKNHPGQMKNMRDQHWFNYCSPCKYQYLIW